MKHIVKHIATALLVLVGMTTTAQVADNVIIQDETINASSDPALLNVRAGQSITIKPTTWIQVGTVFSAMISVDAYIPVSLDNNENYVFTRVFQAPITETELNDPTIGIKNNSDVIESITYFDGLSRAKQQIGIKASPNKKDIVTHVHYDDYGRQAQQFLPFERQTGNLGRYSPVNITNDINAYYQNKYQDDFTGMAVADINAYSESIFEASPLNRVLEQGAPGKDWKANTETDTDHTIKFDWTTNTDSEVLYFEVDFPDGSNTEAPTLIKDGYYAANELTATITKDENWKPSQAHLDDHTTREYKDKLGRVILKRTYNQGIAHNTHYVYDDFGNLTYVLPPKVTLSATDGVSAEELTELCYQYKYDSRNRLVEKKIPGKDWEYIVYNQLDQPVMTQDEIQRLKKEWLFTKYDAFGRVAYTGLHRTNDTTSRITMQELANNTNTYEQYVAKTTPSDIAGTTIYYTNTAIPIGIAAIYTINYYDNHIFDHSVTNPGTVLGQTVDTNAQGLATGSKVRVLETDDWITTVTYYDQKGRPIYIHSTNEYLNTVDIIESKLDFAGKVLKTKTTHTKGTNTAIVTLDTFTYDHMGRLLDQRQTINDQAEEQIVSNIYDALGQLETKEVGGGLQTVDYTYNVRGWLKDINNDSKNDNDLFNFGIKYNDITDVSKKLYNGNISQTQWSTASNNTTNNPISDIYTYSYDALNRITSAIDNTGHYNLTSVGYDKNGNILNLQRNGHTNSNATSFGVMDNLGYTYDNGNKLIDVVDSGNRNVGFIDLDGDRNDYQYDANGNLTLDVNKKIIGIAYNHLNLPTSITFQENDNTTPVSIRYIYDAIGTKLRKTKGWITIDEATEYAGNYIYKNDDLEFMNHPEGYLEPENDGTFSYIYQYKDHLGNIRLSYADANNDSSISVSEILEENNYYPFGLQHKGYNNTITGRKHNWTFNNKEFQEELGLEWYDYGFRNYDPAIGRFMNIDPHADSYYWSSPYVYAFNNPTLVIDPDGRDGIVTGSGTEDDPYVVQANYYYYGLNKKQAAGLQKAISAYNNDGEAFKIKDGDGNNVYVSFNLEATEAASEEEANKLAQNDYIDTDDGGAARFGNTLTVGGNSKDNHFGNASRFEVTLNQNKVDNSLKNTPGSREKDVIAGVFIHEIGHNIGGNHGDPGNIMSNVSIREQRRDNCQGNCGTGKYSYGIPSVNKKGIQAIMGRVNMIPGSINSSYLTDKQNKRVQEADPTGTVGRLYRNN